MLPLTVSPKTGETNFFAFWRTIKRQDLYTVRLVKFKSYSRQPVSLALNNDGEKGEKTSLASVQQNLLTRTSKVIAPSFNPFRRVSDLVLLLSDVENS